MPIWLTITSIVIISLVGTAAHFLYDFSRHNQLLGLFSAVNESTWEHIKIALTPIILWSLVDGAICGQNPNYFLAKLASLLIPIFVIPLIFYTYTKLIKKSLLPLDIGMFILAIALAQLAFAWLISLPAIPFIAQYFACLGCFILFGAYTLLTLLPLRTFLFLDPITNRYGFKAHSDKFNPFKKKPRQK
ncbi:hypothetical protein IJI55_03390 [Candidatus Saccharibacteria bacterium]|nr:hypothetical protein [Candidatus Saccharibacteria bacterium]